MEAFDPALVEQGVGREERTAKFKMQNSKFKMKSARCAAPLLNFAF
jgi:hypothetical protein